MENKKISLFLAGRIPSKKNSKQMIFARGRRFIIPSKQYAEWHKLMSQVLAPFRTPTWKPLSEATIEISITFPDNIKADLTNKAESVMDLLVDNCVLEDDNHKVCKKLTLISGGVDKNRAGAQIEISY